MWDTKTKDHLSLPVTAPEKASAASRIIKLMYTSLSVVWKNISVIYIERIISHEDAC